MKLKEIVRIYEEKIPKSLAEDWDNIGLLVGDEEMEVTKVLTAIEVTFDVLDYAIENDVDLIFVHHPLIFTSIKTVTNDPTGIKIRKLIKNDIAVYVSHTNIDNYEDGLNKFFLEKIAASDIVKDESGVFLAELDFPNCEKFAEHLKSVLRLNYINFIGDINTRVRTVGVVTGSGTSFISDDIISRVDVFLTGDVKYHQAMDVLEKGGNLIDVTHYGSEFISGELFENILNELCPKLEVESYKEFRNPFQAL